jgi:hypothetical protein
VLPLLVGLADAAPPAAVVVPADPFAGEYAPPRATEVGTTAGQLRVLAALGGGWDHGASLAGQGTFELMTIPWIGVRASALATAPLAWDAQLVSFRLGPSFHLLPYRRVDLSLFFDGGPALVDVATSHPTVMPVLAGGGALDVALPSYFVLHFEGLVQGGIADRQGAARTYVAPIGLAGIGLTL